MNANTKKIVFSGLMLAVCLVTIFLSNILELNTIYLLAVAAFSVGIIIYEYGIKHGLAYFFSATILSFFLAPNKFYCLIFFMMAIYIFVDEAGWIFLHKLYMKDKLSIRKMKMILYICKYVIFNLMFVPMIFLFSNMFFSFTLTSESMILILVIGQIVVLVYDRAYEYFQRFIWNKYRKHFI